MDQSDFPEIDKINEEIININQKAIENNYRKKELLGKKRNLQIELDNLKDWIWRTNNPNIVELRRELLAAARLIYDYKEDESDEQSFDDFFDEIPF